MKLTKNQLLKIPEDISILYCDLKQIITIIGPLKKKSLKLSVKINIDKEKKCIIIDSLVFYKGSNHKKKTLKSLQGTLIATIKQLFIETSTIIYKKLKFIGVGYRGYQVDKLENKLLMLKLGYSHNIYFKISKKLNIFCLKLTKLFIYGDSYNKISQAAALFRTYKKPEPYKGKGILYENEKIKLKEGKKI